MTDYDMRPGGKGETPLSLRMTLTLSAALALIDRTLGIGALLADRPAEVPDAPLDRLHLQLGGRAEAEGCRHMALNPTRDFDPDGFATQPRTISWHIEQTGAKRVLELDSGAGFNTLFLAAAHSGTEVTGLDPLPRHGDLGRARARDQGIGNARFLAGRIEDLPDELTGFDVIFGVETLCHAANPERTLRAIARALRPGGRFVQFDPFRNEDVGDQPAAMVEAMRLFETASTLPRGFRPLSAWRKAMLQAGLVVRREQDLTANILPALLHRQGRAVAALGERPRSRGTARPSPGLAAAIVAPMVYCGPGPQPMPPLGTLRYAKIVAHRPR